jgi:hypothetical protein
MSLLPSAFCFNTSCSRIFCVANKVGAEPGSDRNVTLCHRVACCLPESIKFGAFVPICLDCPVYQLIFCTIFSNICCRRLSLCPGRKENDNSAFYVIQYITFYIIIYEIAFGSGMLISRVLMKVCLPLFIASSLGRRTNETSRLTISILSLCVLASSYEERREMAAIALTRRYF